MPDIQANTPAIVSSKGFEPISSESESKILSIELRGHCFCKFTKKLDVITP